MSKSIIVRKRTYSQASLGVHSATFYDLTDKGLQDFGFGSKHMLELQFAIEEKDPETGERLILRTLVVATLNAKSKLAAIVAALLNGAPVPAQLDLGQLTGLACQVVVVQKRGKDGEMYSNISSVLSAAKPPSAGASEAAPAVF